jgi:phosphatidylglycerophosphate synthase
MSRPSPLAFFKQSLKSDSYHADELINIYLLRPLAAALVWLVYPTRLIPNHITLLAIFAGLCAAGFYAAGSSVAVAIGGLLMTTKDILDDADGQLARAKKMYSRRGRFLDSIGDFVVDLSVFTAITYTVYQTTDEAAAIVLGVLGFLGITLRVSYHVFYQVSFLHREERGKLNRITEEITAEDREGDKIALRLQQVFLLIYGWQDRMMVRLDQWCKRKQFDEEMDDRWYSDKVGLRLSGLMGFGTELALLTACSLANALNLYLVLNVSLMNGIWAANIAYRRIGLARKKKVRSAPSSPG